MNRVPMPRNHRHRLFVAAFWNGMSSTAAYFAAGYRTSYAAARSSSSRLRRREDVARCLLSLQILAAGIRGKPDHFESIVSKLRSR